MQQSIPIPRTSHSHLRLIREEDSPTYDGEWQVTQVVLEPEPSPEPDRRRMTAVDKEVLESLGELVGASAGFLYCVLESHADKDGQCFPSIDRLARLTGLSERWVRDGLRRLEAAGFVTTKQQTNRFGAQMPNSYELPFHPRTYRAEGGAEVPPEVPPAEFCPQSNSEVVGSKKEVVKTPPKKTRAISHATQVPEDLLQLIPADVWQAMKMETQLSDEQMRFETAMMIDRNLAKEGTSKNWIASWRSWLRSPYRKSQPSSNGAWVPSHV